MLIWDPITLFYIIEKNWNKIYECDLHASLGKKVMKYLDTSKNSVLYRVTPYFAGKELLARGVEIEAYSVEDHGKGVCIHVFVYNVQPGIKIDYATGKSLADK